MSSTETAGAANDRSSRARGARRRPVASLALAIVASAAVASAAAGSSVQEAGQLYRTLFLRAAPGELAAVVERIETALPEASASGPWVMRHSQGDHWDLMILEPVAGVGEFTAFGDLEAELTPRLAWREELWVRGAPIGEVAARMEGAGYFHIEVFLALAGRRETLLEQRAMENVYLEEIGRDPNLVFARVAGAAWDSYTLGAYRDLKHFAESADVSAADEDRAARVAGFQSAATIGTYLRSLIASHHDTLATRVR